MKNNPKQACRRLGGACLLVALCLFGLPESDRFALLPGLQRALAQEAIGDPSSVDEDEDEEDLDAWQEEVRIDAGDPSFLDESDEEADEPESVLEEEIADPSPADEDDDEGEIPALEPLSAPSFSSEEDDEKTPAWPADEDMPEFPAGVAGPDLSQLSEDDDEPFPSTYGETEPQEDEALPDESE